MADSQNPRYALLNEPTPLQRLERTERQLGRSGLYVKRDDHMPIALGGNKLRSLEYWLGEAFRRSADILLVAGGPTSNQCRLTAAAATVAGLDCLVLHNADRDSNSERDTFLNKVLGASVRFLGPVDEGRRAEEVAKAAAELKEQGRRPYIVGDPTIGALGYVRAAQELYDQSCESGAGIRHVILPGSMGTTEAGFIMGNTLLDNPFEVHLVSVEYDREELAARVERIYKALAAHIGHAPDGYDAAPVHFHMNYLGVGYGQPTEDCEQAILQFARTEGIFLEHIYTGKTFAGFLDLVQKDNFPAGEAACVIHTGGVPSLFSQFDMFKSIG